MSHELSEDQVSTFKEVFTLFDKEGEGFISPRELGTVFRLLGMRLNDSEVKDIISKIDTDENGRIEFSEFLSMMDYRMKRSAKEDRNKKLFRLFDQSQKGFISNVDIAAVMTDLGERLTNHEIAEMMKEADINKNGKISFAEFMAMLEKLKINLNRNTPPV